MSEDPPSPWPRSLFEATSQPTKIFFVCFADGPLTDVPIDRARFGLPDVDLIRRVQLHEHTRVQSRQWFEGWWAGAFGVYARKDLGDELPLLTDSRICFSLELELPDHADLSPLQTVWGLARWLCARGAQVVLDVHAFRFRSRTQLEQLSFDALDVTRELKLVLEVEPSQGELHLLHTRGLCKAARPELLCFVAADDAAVMADVLNQLARTLMEGALPSQLRLRVAEEVELVTADLEDQALVQALGLEQAVQVVRRDRESLAHISRLT